MLHVSLCYIHGSPRLPLDGLAFAVYSFAPFRALNPNIVRRILLVRALFCLATFLVIAPLAFTADKDAKVPPAPLDRLDRWDTSYLEKEWGIRLQRIDFYPSSGKAPPRFELLITFGRDIPDTFMSEFSRLFPAMPGEPCTPILFYGYDYDDVVVGRIPFHLSAGELTGKAGDAFRVSVFIDKPLLEKILDEKVIVPGPNRIVETGKIKVRPVITGPVTGEYFGATIIRIK